MSTKQPKYIVGCRKPDVGRIPVETGSTSATVARCLAENPNPNYLKAATYNY